MTNLPPDYIDEWIQGEDRKLLEIYYTAERSEGGSADEVILRGLKAVLAHASQQVEIHYQGQMQCSKCGEIVLPVEGVSAIWDREYWWHAGCCQVFWEDGRARVCFPSTGKLLPFTILQ